MTQIELGISANVKSEEVAFDQGGLPGLDRGEVSGSLEAIGIVVWVYNHLPSSSREALDVLKEFLKPNMIETVERVLVEDMDGLRMLRNHALTPILEEMGRHSDQKVRDCAARLLIRQQRPARWIFPWPKRRLPDRPQTAHGVQALELSANPFGPEQAELDPLLEEYGIRPRAFWDRICGPRPILVIGPSGSGKTAAALMLAYDCGFPPASPREKGAFPVFCVPKLEVLAEMDGRVQLDQVARALAETLLQVVAEDPYLFFDQDLPGRTAVACLMLWYLGLGSLEHVAPHLERAGLERSGAGEAVLKEMHRLTGSAPWDFSPDETTLLDLLGKARPFGYTCTYVLVDLGIEPDTTRMQTASGAIRSLLERTIHLARNGVYIKTFLPERLMDSLGGDLPVESVELSWDKKDLWEMLKRRLAYIGVPSLASIYRDPGGSCPDPDRWLVEAADLSPRRLICLGNEMLSRVKTLPLKPEHLLGMESHSSAKGR
jgi:hypothetical protein